MRAVVVDNDDEDLISGRIAALGNELRLSVTYIHAPARNISIARNACLEAAGESIMAFIDDDETAAPDWIQSLLDAQKRTKAGVVLGPAHAVYPNDAPTWMVENAFHSNIPVANGDTVETGNSCNVLMDMSDPRIAETRFDLAFGKTGGEDVDFFFRLHRKGVQMTICMDAKVTEPVDPKRMSLKWLVHRKMFQGTIYGHCVVDGQSLPQRLQRAATSSVKALYCALRTPVGLIDKTKGAFWLLRGALHLGIVRGAFTPPKREFYGGPKPKGPGA